MKAIRIMPYAVENNRPDLAAHALVLSAARVISGNGHLEIVKQFENTRRRLIHQTQGETLVKRKARIKKEARRAAR